MSSTYGDLVYGAGVYGSFLGRWEGDSEDRWEALAGEHWEPADEDRWEADA